MYIYIHYMYIYICILFIYLFILIIDPTRTTQGTIGFDILGRWRPAKARRTLQGPSPSGEINPIDVQIL